MGKKEHKDQASSTSSATLAAVGDHSCWKLGLGMNNIQAAIVEASSDPSFSASIDGEVLTWNPEAASLFGYSEAEAVGQSLGLLVPQGREGSEHLQWHRVWNGEPNLCQETTCRHKDGRLLHVWLAMARVSDAQGGGTRVVIVARRLGGEALARSMHPDQ